MKRSWIVALLALALTASAPASERDLVIKLRVGVVPERLTERFPLLQVLDRSAGGSKLLVRVLVPSLIDPVVSLLRLSPLVDIVDFNHFTSTGGQSGKGSTIPVVAAEESIRQWNPHQFDQVNLPATFGGRGVRVAVLDTGLAPNHPLWSRSFAATNFVNPRMQAHDTAEGVDSDRDGVPDRLVGHGTLISSLIAEGASNAHFYIAKVADADGQAPVWNIVKAMDEAQLNRVELVNISLGMNFNNAMLADSITQMEKAGITVVAAIGNQSHWEAMYPARYTSAICVGGIDLENRKGAISNWSTVCNVSAPIMGRAVDAWGEVRTWEGTSYSAGFVSGAIASALGGRTHSPAAIRSALRSSGSSLNPWNPSYRDKLGVRLNGAGLRTALGAG